MQTQKEEIRNKILAAAKEEFLNAGYRRASMRAIAERAGITPGNIYAYFLGKEDLLDQVVSPTMEALGRMIREASRGAQMNEPSVKELADRVTEVFLSNRTQFLILMNGAEGSRYENTRQQITAFVTERVEEEMLPKLPAGMQGSLLAETLSQSILSGIFYLFEHYDGDEETLRRTLGDFLLLVLGGVGA